MKYLLPLSAALAGAVILTPAGPAAAILVPAATLATQCVNGNPPSFSGGDGVSVCSVPGGDAQVVGTPWVALQASVNDSGVFTQLVQAHLVYYFVITGGASGTPIPIDVSTNLFATGPSVGPVADAYATISVGPQSGGGGFSITVCNDGSCARTQFEDTVQYTGLIDQVQEVQLTATAEGIGFNSSAEAGADPHIFVDPSFPGADQLQIVLSDGIANQLPPTGVPEPAGWALMLTGFGLLGGLLRRERIKKTAPA